MKKIYKNYQEYKKAISKEVNEFPMFFAFSNKQFEEGKARIGVKDDSELCKIAGGGFIKKVDCAKLTLMLRNQDDTLTENIKADKTGKGFIYSMFLYELNNHEYGYTYELDDTLRALGLTIEHIRANNNLSTGLELARKEILANN